VHSRALDPVAAAPSRCGYTPTEVHRAGRADLWSV